MIYELDACRADRMAYAGYERPTTPALDELAADPDAVVYLRHYVAGNWTKASTASLFTGRYVYQHGVAATDKLVEGRKYRSELLPNEAVTLAEVLQTAGYQTYGLVTSHHLAPRNGFDQGFSEYYDPENLKVGDRGRNDKLAELIEQSSGPYFAYVHQNACHNPFRLEDRDPTFMSRFGFEYDEEARAQDGIDFTTSKMVQSLNSGDIELQEPDVRFLSLAYDAKLLQVNRTVVGPMIDMLRRLGRWDRTLLVVTADHGEELYEHSGYAHGHALWNEVIHVPLIVKFPKGLRPAGLPKRVSGLTSNMDLYPSLLSFLGLPVQEDLAGRSLFTSPGNTFVFSEGSTADWTLIRGQSKLLVDKRGKRLYDLEYDPDETHDLAPERPGEVAMLTALVAQILSDRNEPKAPAIETELSQETIGELRSLGYLLPESPDKAEGR